MRPAKAIPVERPPNHFLIKVMYARDKPTIPITAKSNTAIVDGK